MSTATPAGTIRIRRRIDSETLHLPELKGLVGQEVEITVRAAGAPGVKAVQSIEELRSPELADAFEGFDEALEEWRKEPWRAGDSIDPGEEK
jgi:hypothetical protein